MDPKRKQEIYAYFRSAFLKLSEQTVEYVKAKTQLSQEEIDQFIANNLLYSYSEDKTKIVKKELLEFQVYKLTSEEKIEVKILDLKDKIEQKLGEVPYVRFNQQEGHIALPCAKENMTTEEINIDDQHKIKVSNMNIDEKKDFSKEHGPHIEGILRQKYGRSTKIKIHGLLSHKKGIYLGFTKFKSLQEVKNVFNKALKNTKPGERVGEPIQGFLKELVTYHPKGNKKMENFDHFEVSNHPEHQDTKCFFVVRKDETKEDFSYVKCIKEISRLIKQQIQWIKLLEKFITQNMCVQNFFQNKDFL